MDNGLIPARYAKALYKYALEKHVAVGIYDAMGNLDRSFTSVLGQKLKESLSNPSVKDPTKRELIMAAAGFHGQATKESDVLNDFITLLIKNNRISELRGIVNAYGSLYRKENKIRQVHVTWASEPDKENEERLKSMIQQKLGESPMEYSSSINPSLIGGFKVAIDNEQLDASVENELRQLRQKLLSK
ncbi:MAG: ATP synthase F1 subunit delta [Muribaculaceae bacterium]|nr:ATP synthase F1 subunit delta [Muribaculaceae bacterium]